MNLNHRMKQLSTDGYDLIPDTNGGIFWKNTHWDYFRWKAIGEVDRIPQSEYLSAKFWPNYEKILPFLEDEDEHAVKTKDWGVVCCGYRNFYFQWFDEHGSLVQRREDIWFDSIYGFCVDPDSTDIWYVIPTFDCVEIYSFLENRVIFSNREKDFDSPEDVYYDCGKIYVSDMGNHRIAIFDAKTKELENSIRFDESVWEYRRSANGVFVRLKSGVYLLDSE